MRCSKCGARTFGAKILFVERGKFIRSELFSCPGTRTPVSVEFICDCGHKWAGDKKYLNEKK